MQLYDFQKQVLKDTSVNSSVLYALEMGLGKTFIGAEKLWRIQNYNNLVVCQKSKVDDWCDHFKDNYDIIVYDLTSKKQYDLYFEDIILKHSQFKVGVINYDLLWRRKELKKLKHYTLLLDESSLIQNEKTERAKFVLKMQPANTILLSGTVVNGNYERLWSQCHLLGWEIPKKMFYQHYIIEEKCEFMGAVFKKIVGYKNVDRLKNKLREYGGVFMKTDEVLELPEQNFQFVKCKNIKEYREFERKSVVKINNELLSADFNISERLVLRQLAGVYNKNKLKALEDLMESTDDRLIIFYTFNKELDAIHDLCEKLKRPVSVVNGSVKDLSNYEECENSITLIQYGAGAFGLNLQKANKIIYFTLPDGNSEVFDQSIKRIHRIGQQNICFYYILETENSIEQEIIENLKIKQKRRDYLWE